MFIPGNFQDFYLDMTRDVRLFRVFSKILFGYDVRCSEHFPRFSLTTLCLGHQMYDVLRIFVSVFPDVHLHPFVVDDYFSNEVITCNLSAAR